MRISDWSSDVCSSDLVENLAAPAHRLGDAAGADGHDHEFLHVDRIVGMFAAVDDVHHRHRQGARRDAADIAIERQAARSEEHTSELQSLMRISYAVFCLKKQKKKKHNNKTDHH